MEPEEIEGPHQPNQREDEIEKEREKTSRRETSKARDQRPEQIQTQRWQQ